MSTPPLQDPTLRLLEDARNYNDWQLDRARPYLRGRVVDYGGGIGTFSVRIAPLADELLVVEPDPSFAGVLRERLGEDARVLARDELEPGCADAIVCFNVLEHIPDHEAAMRRFHELLKPGGHLLLLVPGHRSLYGTIDRSVGHARRYGKDDVRLLFEKTGLVPVEVRRVNPVGALGWLLWSRLLRSETLPERSTRLYDRLVPLFRLLDRVELPVGLSVWAVARRE